MFNLLYAVGRKIVKSAIFSKYYAEFQKKVVLNRCRLILIYSMEQLHAVDLVKRYRKRAVVDGVSVEINPGETVGLLGPNGAGKTTTFYMIIGFIRPNGGDVFLGENNITKMPMYKRAGMGIGYLAQEPSVFRKLTVEENIKAILQMRRLSRKKQAERLEFLLNELDISHLRRRKAYSLSGGERRRVEITRTLVSEPSYILLDEPFAGIDPIAVEDIQKIINRLTKNGLGVLITDHNVRETLSICDRAYIMCDGKILKEGTSQYLAEDPEARKIYLGEKFRLN